MTVASLEQDTFRQPGPGGWKQLADHFPGALTPEFQRIFSQSCPAGMAMYMERYGVLARSVEIAFVNGYLYLTPVPIFGPREMRRSPPIAAVWLMARMHPEFRRRTRAAERALATRPWREVTAHWFSVERTQWHQRNTALQIIDPSALTNTDLAEHLRACRVLVGEGYQRHFELHGDDLLPVGLLITRCAEWGVDAATAMRALDGASPLSAGTATPPDWQLITGYDLDCLAWVELVSRPTLGAKRSAPDAVDLRDFVLTEHHDELQRLVDDARAAVPLRDDNGVLTAAWPMGLLRRAMLAAGRRLGFIDPSLAVEMATDELLALLDGAATPSVHELTARRADRARRSQLTAPNSIGPEFAIPPLNALPRPLARIGAAQLATADHMMVEAETAGIGVGDAPYTGRALVVDDPSVAVDLIEPGDVVVTHCTSPSWNSILVLAGALVTAHGGLLSHATIIARELGIAAVIGDATACTRLVTGMTVTVDPRNATVTIV